MWEMQDLCHMVTPAPDQRWSECRAVLWYNRCQCDHDQRWDHLLSNIVTSAWVHWVTINTGQWSQACAWTPLVSCALQLHPEIQCKECWVWTILSRAGCGHWSWYRHRKEEQTSQCSVVGVDADMIPYWRVMIQLFRAASNGHQHLFSIVLSPFIALC